MLNETKNSGFGLQRKPRVRTFFPNIVSKLKQSHNCTFSNFFDAA